MLRSRRSWVIIIIVVAIAAGGAYVYYSTNLASAEKDDEVQAVQTSTVRQGDLTISANAVGTIIPATEVSVSFPAIGLVEGVLVQVGQEVQEGDILARLDDTDAQQNLAAAELALTQAGLQTESAAHDRTIALAELEVSEAGMNLANTQAALDELLNWTPDEDEVALAEANLNAAQGSFYSAAGSDAAKQYSVDTAQISLEQAQRDLAGAQENYDNASDSARDWEPNIDAVRDAAAASLQRAQDNVAIAEANLNSARANATYGNSASAQSNVLGAEQALATILAGASADEIEAAQLSVEQLTIALERARINLAAAQDITQAELDLMQAQMNVDAARAALEETILRAPMSGTVLVADARPGERSATLFTLANLEQPLIEVFLDETDLDKVGLGFEAEVVFDALPNETFTGVVVQVDPQLSTVNGVSTVRAVLQLDYAKPQTLPIGLNAAVDVIGGRAENALLVPVEALREIAPGQYAVFVMAGGEPVLTFVEVGLMDFTFAEIRSGLERGDIVTTGIVETQ